MLVSLLLSPRYANAAIKSNNELGHGTPASSQVLIKNDRHFISATYEGDYIRFVLESLTDHTDDLRGDYPKVDFAGIQVDVNQNGHIDSRSQTDVSYGIVGGTYNQICTQYLLREGASTGCGVFKSRASLRVEFKQTTSNGKAHPVWTFRIPKSELSNLNNGLAHLTFKIYQAGVGYTRYPDLQSSNATFSKVQIVRLNPMTNLAAVKKGVLNKSKTGTIKDANKSKVLQNATLAKSNIRGRIVANKSHYITAVRNGNSISFTLEATTDHTNNLQGKYPQLDFASISVDVNQNGRIDNGNVDVAYGIRNGSYNQICTQYLLTENSSTACGGFKSRATLKVGFSPTTNSSRPHPVWVFSIPTSELSSRNNNLAHLTFRIHQAGSGYTRYPEVASSTKFSSVVKINLQTLKVISPSNNFASSTGKEITQEQQADPIPETKVNDTKPPEVVISHPADAITSNFSTEEKNIIIQGHAEDESGIYEVLVNDFDAKSKPDGTFSKNVKLALGANRVEVRVSDIHDNVTTQILTINRNSRGIDGEENEVTPPQLDSEGIYYALLIAVQDYSNPDINSLSNPVSDAQKLAEVLTTKYTFEEGNVKMLVNPDRFEIYDALEDLAQNLQSNDNLIIFFAGHGQWDAQFEKGYWLPRDASPHSKANWISNDDVRSYMKGIKSRHTLLISDACFGGSIFVPRGLEDADDPIMELFDNPSRKAMSSGNRGEEVPDKSVFLQYLTKKLNENTLKYWSADQLFYSFRLAVIGNGPTEPQYGVVYDAGDEGGEFIFIKKE